MDYFVHRELILEKEFPRQFKLVPRPDHHKKVSKGYLVWILNAFNAKLVDCKTGKEKD